MLISTNLFIYLPAFLVTGLLRGMYTNGTQAPGEVSSLPNPTTRKGWPHYRGLRPLLFSNSGVGSFTSRKNKSVKVLWDGTYSFSSLSEKTRKSKHLQMSLQRQHFLLSYLKTLSVGPAGVWTRDLPLGRPALCQLSYWTRRRFIFFWRRITLYPRVLFTPVWFWFRRDSSDYQLFHLLMFRKYIQTMLFNSPY